MTLGHVVLCVDEIDEAMWRHELAHVAQYERLGALFLPAYGLASLWALARGRDVYRDNLLEVRARRSSGY